jgi:hypothetical protein
VDRLRGGDDGLGLAGRRRLDDDGLGRGFGFGRRRSWLRLDHGGDLLGEGGR